MIKRILFVWFIINALIGLALVPAAMSDEAPPAPPPTTEVPCDPSACEVPPTTVPPCEEDDPCWDCATMGNGLCGGMDIGDALCIDDTQPQCEDPDRYRTQVAPAQQGPVAGSPVTAG